MKNISLYKKSKVRKNRKESKYDDISVVNAFQFLLFQPVNNKYKNLGLL